MPSNDDELDEMRQQLGDAPEELRALQAGHLDAVISATGPKTLLSRTSSEKIYRLIIEQMREGAVLVPSGRETIVYCNRSFAVLLGSSSEHVMGRPVSRLLVPLDDAPPARELLEDAQPQQGDYRLLRPNGEWLPVSISATTILEAEAPLRCLIVNDLRVRRDVEHLQQVREQLEQSNRRKNELLALLGHELRNPLAPVQQAVELMEANAAPGDATYLIKARDVLTRQVAHLKRLVDDLLDVGRVTQGTLTIERTTLDLRDAILAAQESAERLLDRRGHQVHTSLLPQPMHVHGDLVRLTQVFANLISNAAKYTPDHGHIAIVAQGTAAGYEVIVRDDGRGIAADVLPYLFEPFVQNEATIDRASGGIGVGLTLVRRIVELHGGRVSAFSEGEGEGSEFEVWLPRLEPEMDDPPAPAAESEPEPGKDGPRRILVVDDNEDAAEMLGMVLMTRGYRVEVAFDGTQALELLETLTPHVVLLDIGLPDIDGYEVARRTRASTSIDQPRIIALTGYGQPEDRRQAFEAGFDYHMVKPVATDDLLKYLGPEPVDPDENEAP